MGVIGRLVGFTLGFLLLTGAATAVNLMYRNVWLPLALITALGLLFGWHPRLSKSPAAAWFVAVFGFGEIYTWMQAVGPAGRDTEKLLYRLAEQLPFLVLALTVMSAVIFMRRNLTALKPLRLGWMPAFVILTAGWTIAYFSGGKGGADPMVQFLVEKFGLGADPARIAVIAVRKCLHFLVYGFIALSAYRLASPRPDRNVAAVFGLMVALSFALFDELRQVTATNRTGSAWDVGLDMLGATTFIGVSVLRYGRQTQRGSAPTRLSG